LPGATGARLNLDSLALGGSLDVRSGICDGSVPRVCETVTSAGSRLRVELAWADGAAGDRRTLDEIMAALLGSVERMETARRLRQEVETDPLTGVGNRRRAAAALRAAIGRAERTGEEVAVLAFDLDHFKRVNDGLGHEVGDKVLVAFANVLVEQVRVYASVARTGGGRPPSSSPCTPPRPRASTPCSARPTRPSTGPSGPAGTASSSTTRAPAADEPQRQDR